MAKLGNVLGNLRGNILDGGAGFATAAQGPGGGLFREVTDGSRTPYHVPTIFSYNMRALATAGGWNTGDGWTNYHVYQTGNTTADCERSFWHALGTHRENTYAYEPYKKQGELQFAKNDAVIYDETMYHNGGQNSYTPTGHRMMFLRNHHPSATQNMTMWSTMSESWGSGHDGAGISLGTPNNTSYANTTGMTWTSPWQGTGTSTSVRDNSWNISIPAQRTVAVILNNTAHYTGGTSSSYSYRMHNGFYNLNGSFPANFWIQPDMRLTWAAYTYNQTAEFSFNSVTSHQVWNRAAALFGDR
jgi:hypothetical protein